MQETRHLCLVQTVPATVDSRRGPGCRHVNAALTHDALVRQRRMHVGSVCHPHRALSQAQLR